MHYTVWMKCSFNNFYAHCDTSVLNEMILTVNKHFIFIFSLFYHFFVSYVLHKKY